ncbi:hypothetical protein [Frankia gtarii]|uniref:hypothetical protein n=1 Tax=Frankia gtarii TaxID=2950102 RepID=UPI0021BF28AE|nr:hypothetical protein [Frankia gtarii]
MRRAGLPLVDRQHGPQVAFGEGGGYPHVMPETQRDAVDRLDRLFGEQTYSDGEADQADGEELAG